MAQAYQRSHPDYDGNRRSERQPSRGPLQPVTRGVPYASYSNRPDPRHEARHYVLPTPIHDIDQDSDQGSARKRTSMACGRCRRRKIKCNGATPFCQACRSAGVDNCMYQRVGTSQTFNLDTSIGGLLPLAPISPYSPVSPGVYSTYPLDDRSSSLPPYGRSGYTQAPLPTYTYDALDSSNYAVNDESRCWANSHRGNGAVSYYDQETPTTYDYPTPVSRVASNSVEPLSPLNMSTLQSSLPLPLERRLPAPNLVGSALAPENDIRSPISARLSSLCISNPYSRSNSTSWAIDGVERRQPSIHDLAEASMMLPPVTRGLGNTTSSLPALAQETTPLTNAMFVPSQSSEDLTPISSAATVPQSTYYGSTLPSLTTGMLPPTNHRYPSNSSTNSLSAMTTPEQRHADPYYGWTPTNAVPTMNPPSATIPTTTTNIAPSSQDSSQPPTNTGRKDSGVSAGYPGLHHPRPKVVPSTSHASTLEKHDRVRGSKDDQRRSSSAGGQKQASGTASGQSQTQSGGSSSRGGRKGANKPSKGNL